MAQTVFSQTERKPVLVLYWLSPLTCIYLGVCFESSDGLFGQCLTPKQDRVRYQLSVPVLKRMQEVLKELMLQGNAPKSKTFIHPYERFFFFLSLSSLFVTTFFQASFFVLLISLASIYIISIPRKHFPIFHLHAPLSNQRFQAVLPSVIVTLVT